MAALCLQQGLSGASPPATRLLSLCHQRFANRPAYCPGSGSASSLPKVVALAHVLEKWTPAFRQGHAQNESLERMPNSIQSGCDLDAGTRVAGVDPGKAPPRLSTVAARRIGFAFARMARIVGRFERMRWPCRRQRRNAGGRPRPDLSGGGFRPFEARAQELRPPTTRSRFPIRAGCTRSRAGLGSPACAFAIRAACAAMPYSSTATKSSMIVSRYRPIAATCRPITRSSGCRRVWTRCTDE